MRWGNRKFIKTIPLDPGTKVATMHLAPDYTKFHAFSAERVSQLKRKITIRYVTTTLYQRTNMKERKIYNELKVSNLDFDLDDTVPSQAPIVIEDEEERQNTTIAADCLRCHQTFGHISPKEIQCMARRGVLPRRFASCPIPVCTACMYGKATRRPWRTRSPENYERKTNVPTRPGERISVD
jgi:hypothetical protein